MDGGGQSSFWVEEHHAAGDAADDNLNFTPFTFTPKRKLRASKKMKMQFTGWGSTPLIRFLQSLGQDTTNKISQFDVTSIIDNYVNAKRLIHPAKKKRIVCDGNLFSLFGKKTIGRIKVFDLLEQHFVENKEESSADEDDEDLLNFLDGDNEDGDHQNGHKKEPKTVTPKKRKGFAAIIPENIKLLYLKKSLIEELLVKDPRPTFEAKMVGSYVRIKNDPNDYLQKASHQLLQVIGVKEFMENNSSSPLIVFQVSNYFKDVTISLISDDNFTEKECETLDQKMKDGLMKKPTIAEFEEKVRALHEDITNYWLVREISLLQKQIDRANEKGWRRELFEYMERKKLLQKPDEQSRLLREIPNVIAEEVAKVEPVPQKLPDVEQLGNSDSPAPILGGASETPTTDTKPNKTPFWVFSVPDAAAGASSPFIRNLQANEKQGNTGLPVSVPSGPSGNPICDAVAKGTSIFIHHFQANEKQENTGLSVPVPFVDPICDAVAKATSTYIRNLQANEKQGNTGLSVSVPFGASGIPTCDAAANGASTFIRNLQANEKQGNTGLSVSVPSGAAGIRICDVAANGTSTFIHHLQENEKQGNMYIRNLQANEKHGNTGLSVSIPSGAAGIPIFDAAANGTSSRVSPMAVSVGNHSVPIQAPENIQASKSNENNGMMLSLNLGPPVARVVIDLSDDDEDEVGETNDDPVVLNPPLMEDVQGDVWHYADPQGDVQGPFSLVSLKCWWDADYFPLDFKVWKGRNNDEAVYLIDVIRTAFPKLS